jgi:disease resistance protein RPM1
MAKTVILHVITKIGTALAGETVNFALLEKKSKLADALPSKMKLIKNELEIIHPFLKGMDRKGAKNEAIETCTRQVRSLAYEMEDSLMSLSMWLARTTPKEMGLLQENWQET